MKLSSVATVFGVCSLLGAFYFIWMHVVPGAFLFLLMTAAASELEDRQKEREAAARAQRTRQLT